jgi:poly(3-hydroxybutyrate) depolymerase
MLRSHMRVLLFTLLAVGNRARVASSTVLLQLNQRSLKVGDVPSSWSAFQRFAIQFGGLTREFWVYVPSSLSSASPATGLVLFFHGLGVSVENTCSGAHKYSFQAKAQADAKGFIAVCPRGTGKNAFSASQRGWNNEACCGHAVKQQPQVDDVGFVNAMLNNLRDFVLPAKGVAYPTRNIFAFGFSTGGLFSFRLACDLKGRIDGIAPSGAVFNHAFGSQQPMSWATGCNTDIPVWNSLGEDDHFTTKTLGLTRWRQYAQEILSCNASSENQSSPSGDDVSCYEYASCGISSSRAAFCTYDDVGHKVKALGAQNDYWHTGNAWDFLALSVMPSGSSPSSSTHVPGRVEQANEVLESGVTIFLRAHTGKFCTVEGQAVHAKWGNRDSWEAFVVERQAGVGVVHSGDTIFLRAHTGGRVTVQGETLHVQWDHQGAWQGLVIEKKDGSGPVHYGDTIFLKAHTGKRITVENDSVHAKWDHQGARQEFVIEGPEAPADA